MKLWQKKNSPTFLEIDKFTIGEDPVLDLNLAPYDILGSFAHALMLQKIGILTKKEIVDLGREFKSLYLLTQKNEFIIEQNVEDVHSQIEFILTKKLGDLGKKIHTARSRNDQVLLDLKLYARQEIQHIVFLTQTLFDSLIKKSNQHKDLLLPGYTHFQVAMPSSFGLWFGAYAESLCEDLISLLAAYRICNQNPLGSGAGFGSSFPIDRQYTTELLGFENLNYNVVYAQMTRGKFEKITIQAISNIAQTLNKFSMDVCIYINENHQFIQLPSQFTTGSSIMPHKKNPDPFELIRAYTNKLNALANEITMLINNLPSGYHRDLQLTKPSLIKSIKTIKQLLEITHLLTNHIQPNKNILKEKKYDYLFTVEEVNKKILKGRPFRDAYNEVGELVEKKEFTTNKQIQHSHQGSIGNLNNNEIKNKMKKIINEFNFKQANQAIQKLIKKM